MPGREAKSRLLEAAVLLFAEKGYEGVGIREIAAAAGWNSALVAYYFRGKEGIHRAALELACDQVQRLAESFPALPGEAEPDARPRAEAALRETIRTILGSALPEPGDQEGALASALIALFLREMAAPVAGTETLVLAAVRFHQERMDRCIRIIRPDLDAHAVTRTGMSIYGLMLFFLTYKDVLPGFGEDGFAGAGLASLIDHVTGFALQGLRPAT
jgi:AcrR family transcriptional regulator